MKIESTDVWGFEHAIQGMRNPKESWNKSDTKYCGGTIIGKNDMDLCKRLIKGGSEHRKFLRQIMVSVDITAPLYWWKEFDTYKVGITANSTSTMHKLSSRPITANCFELDDFDGDLTTSFDNMDDSSNNMLHFENVSVWQMANDFVCFLESLRVKYIETKDVRYWKELIRWLPESWLQTRTCTMNYENLMNMYHQRKNHKLSEWHTFCDWVLTLPYMKEFLEGVD